MTQVEAPGSNGMSRSRASQRGTALVETSLVLPFLLLLTVCVVDFGRAYHTKNVLVTAAREGARFLAINTVADQALIEARVEQVAGLSGVVVTDVTVTALGSSQMQVTATASFDWLFPGLFQWVGAEITDPMTLTASAVMRDQ